MHLRISFRYAETDHHNEEKNGQATLPERYAITPAPICSAKRFFQPSLQSNFSSAALDKNPHSTITDG